MEIPFYPNTGSLGGRPKGSSNEVVKETLKWMKTKLVEARSNLENAQYKMANMVNHSRRLEKF